MKTILAHDPKKSSNKPSRFFLLGGGLMILLFASIMSRDISESFVGLHSWAQAHLSWLARSHVVYGLNYTNGLFTWAVGMPPPEEVKHYLDHPQLPALLNAISLHIFGVNDWAQRMGALLVSLLSLSLILQLMRRLYDEETALLIGLIYILFPITGYFYWIGTWLLPTTLLAFFCYFNLLFFVFFVDNIFSKIQYIFSKNSFGMHHLIIKSIPNRLTE